MPDRQRSRAEAALAAAHLAVAVALIGLLLWSFLHSSEPQFQGKAMLGRELMYPLSILVVPIGMWTVRRRGRSRSDGRPAERPWPHGIAVLVILPFAIDTLGNAARWYVDIEHFDDAVHALNPVLLVAAAGLALARTAVPTWSLWMMAIGIGSTFHIVWEQIEYLLLVEFGNVELGLTLPDTLSDLGWGLVGSAVGAAVAVGSRGR